MYVYSVDMTATNLQGSGGAMAEMAYSATNGYSQFTFPVYLGRHNDSGLQLRIFARTPDSPVLNQVPFFIWQVTAEIPGTDLETDLRIQTTG